MKKIFTLAALCALALGAATATAQTSKKTAYDLNKDGSVDVSDVTTLVEYVLNPTDDTDPEPQPQDGEKTAYTVNGVTFNMVSVASGYFYMGATREQEDPSDNEFPIRKVTTFDFAIGETEVTQELWEAVMGSNPSGFKGANLPVDSVSWDDCQEFIAKLRALTKKRFRLPTEAEWEFAARGGNLSKGFQYSGGDDINAVAWNTDNSDGTTHPVGTKQANELGIYDMSGNVFEWCADWFGRYPSTAQMDPTGPAEGTSRVFRGGSWHGGATHCRVSIRFCYSTSTRVDYLGLRLAL